MAPREGSVEGRNESGARKKSREEREKKNEQNKKGEDVKEPVAIKTYIQTNPHAALFFFFYAAV